LARWLVVGFTALALIGAAVLAALYILGASNVSHAHRYRLGIAIEIDGQVYSGSSIIEVRWVGSRLPDMGKFTPVVTGQAVYVDLGKLGAVIATLAPGQAVDPAPDGATSAVWLASFAFGNQSTYAELPDLPKLRGRRYLPPEIMPRLVWLRDFSDPKSAKRFRIQDVPALFGPTARFVEAYVEITKDPIVIDIDKKLPWFGQLNRPLAVIPIEYGFVFGRDMFVREAP
jgi:hypothetical protein